MTEEGRIADQVRRRERELDGRVETLVGQLVDLINGADPETRPDVRDYALSLLREGTEIDAPPVSAAPTPGRQTGANTTALGLLIGLVGLPALLLFPPIGLALVGMAAVIIVSGMVGALVSGRGARR